MASAERSILEKYELIVVDDGSRQPRTLEVLAALEAAGYCVVHQENRGLSAARNRGIELATGACILPLDSDNRLLPGFVEAAIRVLEAQPRVGVVYGDRTELGLRSGAVQVPEFDLDTLLTGNFIDACALIRKSTWSECGGFDCAMPYQCWEDWDFWISAAERDWRFHHLPGAAFEYRVRPNSMSSPCSSPEVGQPQQAYIVEKHRDLYLKRLPQLLMMVQSIQRESRSLHEETAGLQRESEVLARELKALAEELKALAQERETLAEERETLGSQRDGLLVDKERLQAERDLLYQELGSWRERVAFMEETAVWRWRERWLRLKRGLQRSS